VPRERDSDAPPTGRRWTDRRTLLLGLLGLVVLACLWLVLTWPDVRALRESNPERTAFIDRYVQRSGRPAAWTWVTASRISPQLKEAVIVAEDLEFFSHGGFSTHEIGQAIRRAIEEREAPRGASTITQQLAKNLWLSPSRNPFRKGREVILTRQLEKHLTKNRILELYLNVVEFGPGVYGAEAAARHYFGKTASVLSPREAAQLAAGLSRPSQWHPGVESPYYARRVETLLTRMSQVTFLDRRFGMDALPPVREPVPLEVREPSLPGGEDVVPDSARPEPDTNLVSPAPAQDQLLGADPSADTAITER
jgi:monofunctional biosynthetic peptidoglycan transglycosylase